VAGYRIDRLNFAPVSLGGASIEDQIILTTLFRLGKRKSAIDYSLTLVRNVGGQFLSSN
jgi:hypothetical protein